MDMGLCYSLMSLSHGWSLWLACFLQKLQVSRPWLVQCSFFFNFYSCCCFYYVYLTALPINFPSGSPQHHAALRLLAASQLINQAVGDALSGMLLVEAVLQHKRWSFQNWCDIYTDLPSKQLKASCYFCNQCSIPLFLVTSFSRLL